MDGAGRRVLAACLRFVALAANLVAPPMVLLGLGLLFVATGRDRLWALPLLAIGLGLTVVWWLLAGRHDPGAPYVSTGRNLAASLAGTWGALLIVFGLAWMLVAAGLARPVGLLWIAAGAALLKVWWRLLGRYGDDE